MVYCVILFKYWASRICNDLVHANEEVLRLLKSWMVLGRLERLLGLRRLKGFCARNYAFAHEVSVRKVLLEAGGGSGSVRALHGGLALNFCAFGMQLHAANLLAALTCVRTVVGLLVLFFILFLSCILLRR